jgi:hypothetical protein
MGILDPVLTRFSDVSVRLAVCLVLEPILARGHADLVVSLLPQLVRAVHVSFPNAAPRTGPAVWRVGWRPEAVRSVRVCVCVRVPVSVSFVADAATAAPLPVRLFPPPGVRWRALAAAWRRCRTCRTRTACWQPGWPAS